MKRVTTKPWHELEPWEALKYYDIGSVASYLSLNDEIVIVTKAIGSSTERGHKIIWWSSNAVIYEPEPGEQFDIDAAVHAVKAWCETYRVMEVMES